MVLDPVEFPSRKNCRLLYNVVYTISALNSSGYFYLTVPKAWVKPGQAAVLHVRGADSRTGTWFAFAQGNDAPLAIPSQNWRQVTHVVQRAQGTAPLAGDEAAYDWYLVQYGDPGVFTPVGPPGDPAEVVVFPDGQLQRIANKEWDLTKSHHRYGLSDQRHVLRVV